MAVLDIYSRELLGLLLPAFGCGLLSRVGVGLVGYFYS